MTNQMPFHTTPLPVRLRVEDYLLLSKAGALVGYAKTELIAGETFATNAQHRPHMFVKNKLAYLIRVALGGTGSLFVGTKAGLDVSLHDAPEPDIFLTSEPRGEGLVPVASVAFVVEVADTSLQHDLRRKAVLYARHGVPECWIADVHARAIHQMWQPGPAGYGQTRNTLFGGAIEAATLPGLRVETASLK